MKRQIKIVLTLLLATEPFTVCSAEEKVNIDIQTSVVSTTDVSISMESSEPLLTEDTAESITTEKAIVPQKSEFSETVAKSEEKQTVGRVQVIKSRLNRV